MTVGAKRTNDEAGYDDEPAEEPPGEQHGVEAVGASFESEHCGCGHSLRERHADADRHTADDELPVGRKLGVTFTWESLFGFERGSDGTTSKNVS